MKNKRCKSAASICIDCAKSGGLCAWSSNFQAVPGWKTQKVLRRDIHNNPQYSTRVIKCPFFESEKYGGGKANVRNMLFRTLQL